MNEPYDTWKHRGLTVSIHYEEYPENPRESWDSLGTILGQTNPTFGPCDNYSDKTAPSARYATIDELVAEIIAEPGCVYVPLQYQDYGSNGARLLTDAGTDYDPDIHNGIIYCERAKWQREYKRTNLTASLRATITSALVDEVATVDAYYQGALYGFVVSDNQDEHRDSCWGFYGNDREAMACLRQQANEAADAIADERERTRKRRAADLATVKAFWQTAA